MFNILTDLGHPVKTSLVCIWILFLLSQIEINMDFCAENRLETGIEASKICAHIPPISLKLPKEYLWCNTV